MKIHQSPLVILVTRPNIEWAGVAALLREYDMEADAWQRGRLDEEGESIPEMMGRLCYGSFGDRQGRIGARDYITNILKGGHGSVLEHACWGFVVCRASRGFTHQMVRHRAGFAFSQESQHFIRYSDVDDEPGSQEAALCATGIPPDCLEGFIAAARFAIKCYEELWQMIRANYSPEAKVKKRVSELARGTLPSSLESRLGFTANARALRHFCELRGTADNALEIRLVAVDVARIMIAEAPALFQDFIIDIADDGYPVVNSEYRKV